LHRVLTPWRFWRSVRVETPIDWRGVAWWVVLCLVLLGPVWIVMGWFAGSLATTLGSLNTFRGTGTFGMRWLDSTLGQMLIDLESVWSDWNSGWLILDTPAWLRAGVATMVAIPLMFLLFPFTRERSKVRTALVLRAAAYSMAWAIPFLVWSATSWACWCAWVAWYTPRWARGGIPSQWSSVLDVLELIGEYSPLRLVDQWSNDPIPAWLALVPFAWLAAFWLFAMKRSWRMPDWLPAWLSCCAVGGVLSFLMMLFDDRIFARMF
jgi:hypothetical protein